MKLFDLPVLPFEKDALEPYMSEETLEYHHGKHHANYVKKLNELIKGTDYCTMTLEEIIHSSHGPIFNNAAQHYNHSFFWQCLSPNQTKPKDDLLDHINNKWKNLDGFKEAFTKSATDNFGSGWTWLSVDDNGDLCIMNTSNADTPLSSGHIPLLTVDVWEHAYYLDYKNERPKFLANFWALVNWDFVAENLKYAEKHHLIKVSHKSA